MQLDLLGNRLERPALLRQVADLLIAQAPVGGGDASTEWGWLGRRGRRRRLDDGGLGSAGQGEPGGRHVDLL
jgi:hypothetical protein